MSPEELAAWREWAARRRPWKTWEDGREEMEAKT